MPIFIIEREIPGASKLDPDEVHEIAKKSNAVVDSLNAPYTWLHSYIAGDKIYCVHETEDAEVVREHARGGGFPADVVSEVAYTFGPQDG